MIGASFTKILIPKHGKDKGYQGKFWLISTIKIFLKLAPSSGWRAYRVEVECGCETGFIMLRYPGIPAAYRGMLYAL